MWISLSVRDFWEQLPFGFILLYFFLIFLSLLPIALFWATIKSDSFSLLRFPFLNHIKDFPSAISPVCCLKYPYSCFFFLPISVSWFLLFSCLILYCHCCYWLLRLFFLCYFWYSPRILLLMCLYSSQWWWVFFLLFLYVVCLYHLLDVRPIINIIPILMSFHTIFNW